MGGASRQRIFHFQASRAQAMDSAAVLSKVFDLLKKYEITEEDFRRQIADVHLERISRSYCEEWESLPSHLGLETIVANDIRKNISVEKDRRYEFLLKWKKIKGFCATYEQLVKALLTIDCANDAEEVCEILKDKPQPGCSSEKSTSSEASSTVSAPPSTTPAGDNIPPNKPVVHNLDDDTLRDLHLRLDKELDDITKQYSKYVRHIRETLKDKGVTVDDLSSNLLTVTAFAHETQQRMLLSTHETELESAASVNKIINLLAKEYASFLNYEIFQFIVDTYHIDQGQDELKYPELLEAYLNRHRVCEFVEINPQLENIASSSKELVLKIDIDVTSSLAKIKDLKTSIAKILKLKSVTLRLFRVSHGCVEVTFQMPAPVAECIFNEHTIFTEEQLKQFQSLSVVKLECGSCSFSFADKVDDIEDVFTGSYETMAYQTTEQGQLHCASTEPPETLADEAKRNRFPYLEETAETSVRMQLESDAQSIQNYFADVFGTVCSTITKKATTKELMQFFSDAGIEDLHTKIGSCYDVTDMLGKINEWQYWTFFDYELLEKLVQKYYTTEDPVSLALDVYIKNLKERRMCEVPADTLKNNTLPVGQSIVYLKTDSNFSTSVSKIKKLEYDLSTLYGTDLHLLDCELGNFNSEFIFGYFKELSKTSNISQMEELKIAGQMEELAKMGLQWMMCFHTSIEDEDPAAGPSAITLIHFPGYDTPFNIGSEETSAAMPPANVRKFKITPSLIADSLPVARMCARCPAVDLNVTDSENQTALIHAAGKNNFEVVKTLLQQSVLESSKIDIDHKDSKGRTAIRAAAENGNTEIQEYLQKTFPTSRIDVEEGGSVASVVSQNQGVEMYSESCSPDDNSDIGEKEVFESQVQETLEVRTPQEKKPSLFKRWKLMSAIKKGDHVRVEKFLKSGIDPDIKDLDMLRWTLLMSASHRGFTETVKVLLEYEADPNIAATNGFTALILASRKGNHEIVRLLVGGKKTADIMARNDTRGWSALMSACETYAGVAGTRKELVTNDAMKNRRIVAELLLKAAAESGVDLVNLEANNGWTPLMQASQDGDVEMVKILVAAGAKLDHQSKSSWSALTTACRKRNEEIVEVLVKAGASVDLTKKGGVTALHIASYQGLQRAMESLVEGGADVNKQDNWGMTPLILAVKHRKKIQYLVQKANADIKIKAKKYASWNACFFAMKNKDKETVEYLLKKDLNIKDLEDEYGHTILTYSKDTLIQESAQMYKHLAKIISDLTEEGATPVETVSLDKNFRFMDATRYTGKEVLWRTGQLPNLILNV